MRFLGRLLLGAFALLVAVPSGAALLVAGLLLDPGANAWLTRGALAGLDMALSDLSAGLPPDALFGLVAGLAKALFVVLLLPPAAIGFAGEAFGARGMLWYGAGSGVLTAAMPWLARSVAAGPARPDAPSLAAAEARLTAILFVVGAGAGLVYWLIAGRSAGRPASTARPAA